MTAHDSGDDARIATADVMITVLRNPEAPEFKVNRYRVTVSPEAILGEPILNVTAEDDDGVSVNIIISNQPQINHITFLTLEALNYFVKNIATKGVFQF